MDTWGKREKIIEIEMELIKYIEILGSVCKSLINFESSENDSIFPDSEQIRDKVKKLIWLMFHTCHFIYWFATTL